MILHTLLYIGDTLKEVIELDIEDCKMNAYKLLCTLGLLLLSLTAMTTCDHSGMYYIGGNK